MKKYLFIIKNNFQGTLLKIIFSFVLLSLFCISCSSQDSHNTKLPWDNETFEEGNKPFFEEIDDEDNSYTNSKLLSSFLLKPWNYEKDYNQTREYPLVIFLHGAGGYSNIPQSIGFLGYNNDEYKTNFPSFVLAPRFIDQWQGDYAELAGKIENIKKNYRIDESRIYIIGYSMGTYWTFPFLNYYYDYNSTLIAGMVCVAGTYKEDNLKSAVKKHLSLWEFIGENDSNYLRTIDVCNSIKNYYTGAMESTEYVPIAGYTDSITTIQNLKGIEVLKFTILKSAGHGIMSLPFKDSNVLLWLFSQDIQNR